MDEPIESLYFNWLCAKVMHIENPTPSLTYWKLLRELHNTEFVWLVSGDDNRAQDGLDLRLEFFRSTTRLSGRELDNLGCSVLEMLIGFARRAEFETDIPEQKWFWMLIKNLHMNKFNDAHNFSAGKVGNILDKFIWRTYRFDGKGGGLFPLEQPMRSQKDLEIWYQFCDYLIEHEEIWTV